MLVSGVVLEDWILTNRIASRLGQRRTFILKIGQRFGVPLTSLFSAHVIIRILFHRIRFRLFCNSNCCVADEGWAIGDSTSNGLIGHNALRPIVVPPTTPQRLNAECLPQPV